MHSIIDSYINRNLHSLAIFYAELQYSEAPTAANKLLLANVYYRSKELLLAYNLLKDSNEYLFGIVCYELLKLDEAERIFREIDTSDALFYLGEIMRQSGRQEAAVECFRKCLLSDSDNILAYQRILELGGSVGDIAESASLSATATQCAAKRTRSGSTKQQHTPTAPVTKPNALTAYKAALASYHRCNYTAAIQLLLQLPDNHLHSRYAQSLLAKLYTDTLQYEKALECFKHTTLYDYHSSLLYLMNKPIELSHLTVSIQHGTKEYYISLGNCFSLEKESEKAIECYVKAIRIDSTYAYGYNVLGYEYLSIEMFDKSIEQFRLALRYNSRLYNAWFGLGLIYYKQEKYRLAEYHFGRSMEVTKNTLVHYYFALCLYKMERYNDAVKVLAECDDSDQVRFKRAMCLKHMGRTEEAIKEISRITTRDKRVSYELGLMMKERGLARVALECFIEAGGLSKEELVSW